MNTIPNGVPKYDTIGSIIKYESDELSHEETLEFFQHLIDKGVAWRLQDHYGRTAHTLIDQGLCTPRNP